MTLRTFIITAVLSLLPISELRGAIPYALTQGVPLYQAFIISVILNALIGPLLHLFLSTLHKAFLKMEWYERLFGRLIERAREKMAVRIEKYGYFGIMMFVAIPLPITGAYTGTLGAWILGMDKKRTFLAVAAGVVIAGVIVSAISIFGIEALDFLIKRIH